MDLTNLGLRLTRRTFLGKATTGIIYKETTVEAFSTNDNVKKASTGGSTAWPRSAA